MSRSSTCIRYAHSKFVPVYYCSALACALNLPRTDDWRWSWYFDSGEAIQIEEFNSVAHFESFFLILLLLQHFELSKWSFPMNPNSEAQLEAARGKVPPLHPEVEAPISVWKPRSSNLSASIRLYALGQFDRPE